MRLRKLTEQILIERELKGQDINVSGISQEIQELINNGEWLQAYKAASGEQTSDTFYTVRVTYHPSDAHIQQANTAGGVYPINKEGYIDGYLLENPNKTVEGGGFLGVKNLGNLGYELIDIVNPENSNVIVSEGYFKILPDRGGATLYNKKDAETVVKKIKGIGSGVRRAEAVETTTQETGVSATEKEKVVDNFIDVVVCGNGNIANAPKNIAKISSFRDSIRITVIGLELNPHHPLIEFVYDYLTNNKNVLNRQGFIVLNNIYVDNAITDEDLINTAITPLLKSNLILKGGSEDVKAVINIYKGVLFHQYSYNTDELYKVLETVVGQQGAQDTIREGTTGEGQLRDNKLKKLVADALVYEVGKEGVAVKNAQEIKNTWTRLRATGGRSGDTTQKVHPDVEAKYDFVKNLNPQDVLDLMSVLRKYNKVK